MTITLSNVMIQYFINGFGTDTITAYTYYFKLENFIYLPVLAFGQATMTFTAQNIGAGKMRRIKKGIVASGSISVLTVVVISTVLLAGGRNSLGLVWKGSICNRDRTGNYCNFISVLLVEFFDRGIQWSNPWNGVCVIIYDHCSLCYLWRKNAASSYLGYKIS